MTDEWQTKAGSGRWRITVDGRGNPVGFEAWELVQVEQGNPTAWAYICWKWPIEGPWWRRWWDRRRWLR
jgi:hypothetical protein